MKKKTNKKDLYLFFLIFPEKFTKTVEKWKKLFSKSYIFQFLEDNKLNFHKFYKFQCEYSHEPRGRNKIFLRFFFFKFILRLVMLWLKNKFDFDRPSMEIELAIVGVTSSTNLTTALNTHVFWYKLFTVRKNKFFTEFGVQHFLLNFNFCFFLSFYWIFYN
jgi:hypothetical protein